ncbi:MAG: hypothetical protein L6408_08020 [Nanoarchaeota archaeon]|nr:hypothetical protein [Nanoarchaeota archaeon]
METKTDITERNSSCIHTIEKITKDGCVELKEYDLGNGKVSIEIYETTKDSHRYFYYDGNFLQSKPADGLVDNITICHPCCNLITKLDRAEIEDEEYKKIKEKYGLENERLEKAFKRADKRIMEVKAEFFDYLKY